MDSYLVCTPLRYNGQFFKPGSRLNLPPDQAEGLREAQAIVPFDAPATPAQEPPIDEELALAIQRLDPHQANHWTRDRKPRIEPLSQQLGRVVSAAERDRVWQARELKT